MFLFCLFDLYLFLESFKKFYIFFSGKITSQRSGVTIVAKKMIFVLTTNAGAEEIVDVFNKDNAVSSEVAKICLKNAKKDEKDGGGCIFEDAELR